MVKRQGRKKKYGNSKRSKSQKNRRMKEKNERESSLLNTNITDTPSFPKDEKRRSLWEAAIGHENISKNARICSTQLECFDKNKFGGTSLKADAIPTELLFVNTSVVMANTTTCSTGPSCSMMVNDDVNHSATFNNETETSANLLRDNNAKWEKLDSSTDSIIIKQEVIVDEVDPVQFLDNSIARPTERSNVAGSEMQVTETSSANYRISTNESAFGSILQLPSHLNKTGISTAKRKISPNESFIKCTLYSTPWFPSHPNETEISSAKHIISPNESFRKSTNTLCSTPRLPPHPNETEISSAKHTTPTNESTIIIGSCAVPQLPSHSNQTKSSSPSPRILRKENTIKNRLSSTPQMRSHSNKMETSSANHIIPANENTTKSKLCSTSELPLHSNKTIDSEEFNNDTQESINSFHKKYTSNHQLDEIDLLFMNYAETFKRFTPRRQANLKMSLANLFGQAESEEMNEQ